MFKKLLKTLLIVLLINMSFVNVFAEQEYVGKTGSINISFKDGETIIPVSGVEFELYKIADLDKNDISFKLLNQYKLFGLNVNFERDEIANWSKQAQIVKNEIIKSNIAPDYQAFTEDGVVTFDNLPVGLYLVTGFSSYIEEDDEVYKYTPQTALVSIPQYNEDDTFFYDIEVINKYEKDPIDYDDEETPLTKLTVVKKFDDVGYENNRPESITVDLYKNNDLYKTVILDEENDFEYTWKYLTKEFTWTVLEREVEGYTVSYDKPDKYSVVITNTFIVPTPPTPNNPAEEPKLPSTGVLWWPVPVLLVTGCAFLILGYNGKKQED